MTGNRTTESFLQEVNIVINKDRLLIALSFSWKYNALLHEKYSYSEFFWFVSVKMLENTDQKNSEYGHFSRIAS